MKKINKNLLPQSIKNIKHYLVSIFYSLYFGRPSNKVTVIGVTGTDGKTTTSNMIYEILKGAGKKVGLITTINAKIGKKEFPTGFHVTTPSPKMLQKFLKDMVDEGLEYVVSETTSHALDQHRVGGIRYAAAVYTNITHEHLDYHGTYDNYLRTKAKLMNLVRPKGFIVINRDDISYEKLYKFAKRTPFKTIRYGFKSDSDLFAKDVNGDRKVNQFEVTYGKEKFDVRLKLLGGYNIYNALAAIATTSELGISTRNIVNALEGMQALEGRWEIMQERPYKIIVDFAHTPNALEKVLTLARKQIDNYHNVIVVFGSAGMRDVEKRPLMGDAAGRLADRVILTAEDPRGESIAEINRQIATGIRKHDKRVNKDYFSIPDRKKAIQKALELARPGDLVIITGKGHEKSMNLDGKTELPWSDQEVVKKLIK